MVRNPETDQPDYCMLPLPYDNKQESPRIEEPLSEVSSENNNLDLNQGKPSKNLKPKL